MGNFLLKPAKSGGFYFDLEASNGKIIASSQVYTTEEACKKGITSVKNNCTAAVEDQTKEGYASLKHPKFEVYKDKADEFRFRLTASNGQNILASQGYTTKESCLNGIDSIRANAPESPIVE